MSEIYYTSGELICQFLSTKIINIYLYIKREETETDRHTDRQMHPET